MKLSLSEQDFILLMAMGLKAEGAPSLEKGSEKAKDAFVQYYLAKYDWDVEVTFNMRELRDAKTDKEKTDLLEDQLFEMAQKEFGAAINQKLQDWLPQGMMRA